MSAAEEEKACAENVESDSTVAPDLNECSNSIHADEAENLSAANKETSSAVNEVVIPLDAGNSAPNPPLNAADDCTKDQDMLCADTLQLIEVLFKSVTTPSGMYLNTDSIEVLPAPIGGPKLPLVPPRDHGIKNADPIEAPVARPGAFVVRGFGLRDSDVFSSDSDSDSESESESLLPYDNLSTAGMGSSENKNALPETVIAGNAGNGLPEATTTTFQVQIPPGQEFQFYACDNLVRIRCPDDCVSGQHMQITVPSNRAPVGLQSPPTFPGPSTNFSIQIIPPPPPPPTPAAPTPALPRNVVAEPVIRPSRPQRSPRIARLLRCVGRRPRPVPVQDFFPPFPSAPVPTSPSPPGTDLTSNREPSKLPRSSCGEPHVVGEVYEIKLSNGKDGWTRVCRSSPPKWQWVRCDDQGTTKSTTTSSTASPMRFDTEESAFVRKLTLLPKSGGRVRDTGVLSLVPAGEAFVEAKVRGNRGEVVATYSEIIDAQGKGFEEKVEWFQGKCKFLRLEWNEGHVRINIRREFLLEDSVDAVMSLNGKDLRKVWRFEFIGEPGIDAGALAREWFELVTAEIFNPDRGLWHSSETNQKYMDINPAAKFVSEDYLVYYRFLGRVLGKALFDGHLVKPCCCAPYVYLHILGWPITFRDLERLDKEYYNNLKQLEELVKNGQDLEMLCLDFSMSTEIMGANEVSDLIPDGRNIAVTNDNFPEFLKAFLRHRMMDRVKLPLTELLLGLFDVIPEPLLMVFDSQELELLLCGLPYIDMQDWMEHTEYSGEFEDANGDCPVCHWFWEVVEEFEYEMKARLLQFATGSSSVPGRGFGVLQGNDGNIRNFTIHGVPVARCFYPRSHPCFNRIDLPMYNTKQELEERLKLVVTMFTTGFDIE